MNLITFCYWLFDPYRIFQLEMALHSSTLGPNSDNHWFYFEGKTFYAIEICVRWKIIIYLI